MSWLAIPSILNKLLPGRQERIRNKINALEKQRNEIRKDKFTGRSLARYERVTNELSRLKKGLENR